MSEARVWEIPPEPAGVDRVYARRAGAYVRRQLSWAAEPVWWVSEDDAAVLGDVGAIWAVYGMPWKDLVWRCGSLSDTPWEEENEC